MKSLIDKNKKISKQRQEFVEHNFEAMVGARKRRYNETPQQKQRTEFLEDYYLLYTRNKNKWQKLKEFLDEDKLFEYFTEPFVDGYKNCLLSIKNKMQELEEEEKLIADILGDKDLTIIGSRVHLKNLIVELKNKIKDKDIVIEEKDKEIERLNVCMDVNNLIPINIKYIINKFKGEK